jgi:hypothetical protein
VSLRINCLETTYVYFVNKQLLGEIGDEFGDEIGGEIGDENGDEIGG